MTHLETGPRRTLAITAVLSAVALAVLDAAIANVALPTIARSLQASPAVAVRIVTAYQLALVMAMLPCAALGESIGYRRVYVAGIALFTFASALCAMSPSMSWLIAARFVQGVGGAAIMSLGVALLRFVVPPERLGTAIGWNALTVALCSAAGPTIGALILSHASWPFLFAVNLPVGAVALAASRALPNPKGSGRRLDFVSVGLNALAFASLVVGAELLPKQAWWGILLFIVTAGGMTALVRRESPKEAPLIPIDLLRGESFRLSVIASVCCFTGQMAGLVALPFYLQHTLGQSALTTGLYLTPWPLTVAVVAPIGGRLSSRIPTAWLCAAGGTCLALGLLLAAVWPLQHDLHPLLAMLILCGLGFGLFQTPNNRNMLLSAPPNRSGAAGGMQGTARLTGQTIGAVMMTLLFTLTPLDVAPRIGLGLGAVLALTAGLVSIRRPP
jgi:DHA2 family multidrug resistance protein-like MFS transporter